MKIMENTKKVTKKENFGTIKDILEGLGKTDLVEVMAHEIELLEKKSANRKSGNSKTQKENEEIKKIIVAELARIGEMVTISELQAKSENLGQYSNQKLSALLKQLVDNGEVVKNVDKKKSYFTIAD